MIDRHNRNTRAFVEGILAGLACAVCSAVILVLIRFSLISAARECLKHGKPASDCLSSLSGNYLQIHPFSFLMATVIGPIIETVLFVLAFLLSRVLSDRHFKSIFVLTMALLGWFLHGASWLSLNRMAAFALLALLYVRWSKEGFWLSFAVTAWAHIIFNFSIFAMSAFAR